MNEDNPLYNSVGSANVWRIEIIGTGKVCGSFNVESEVNGR
jgi:hypothetical protein